MAAVPHDRPLRPGLFQSTGANESHPPLDTSAEAMIRHLLGTGTVQVSLTNGSLTLTSRTSSGAPITVTFTVGAAAPGSARQQAAIQAFLELLSGKGLTAAQSSIAAQVLAALQAGDTVTINVHSGSITVSIPATGATLVIPTGAASGTGSLSAAPGGTIVTSITGSAGTGSPSVLTAVAAPTVARTPAVAGAATAETGAGLGTARSSGLAASAGTATQAASAIPASSEQGSSLAFTGNQTEQLAGLAAVLAGLGGALVFAARRLIRRPSGGHYGTS
jgi:hypothetical protein